MSGRGWDRSVVKLEDGSCADAVCPVIISASRATDIPAFFHKWFFDRLRVGYLRWVNPFNTNQVQYVSFSKTRVIVFWTKNPLPMIADLHELDEAGINYCFQFTLNNYEREGLEPHLQQLANRIETFKRLSEQIGPQRIIWRFDPLILSDKLTVDSLVDRISCIAEELRGFTEKLVISFADIEKYRHVRSRMRRENVNYREFDLESMEYLGECLFRCSRDWKIKISTCAETIDLSKYDIDHNRCVDDRLMRKVFNHDPELMNFLGRERDFFGATLRSSMKDRGQRKDCGCIISKDIGSYDTCRHFCLYCYANMFSANS